ncbi:MAG: glycosyltransferase, partial [Anaerolineae bacterium]
MATKVFFEPLGYIDQSQREMFDFPPEGYQFVLPEPGVRDLVIINGFVLGRIYPALDRLCRLSRIPHLLLKAYVDSLIRRPPPGTALTYAYNHIVFRREPWLCQVEFPTNLVARDIGLLHRWKGVVEGAFASPWCRKIIAWGEEGRQALLRSLDSRAFQDKIEVVPLVVRKRNFVKTYGNNGRVRLFFVGSGNRSGEFHLKGGKEAIEAFFWLNQRYDNLSFVIRSDVPPHWKRRCQGLPNVKIIDRYIPWPKLEEEYKTADIFVHAALFPGYHVAPLDAMSYELPV